MAELYLIFKDNEECEVQVVIEEEKYSGGA